MLNHRLGSFDGPAEGLHARNNLIIYWIRLSSQNIKDEAKSYDRSRLTSVYSKLAGWAMSSEYLVYIWSLLPSSGVWVLAPES